MIKLGFVGGAYNRLVSALCHIDKFRKVVHYFERIFEKIEGLKNNLAGDVKRLTNFSPEYRLRVATYRVLFEIEGGNVMIYRIRHRKDIYR